MLAREKTQTREGGPEGESVNTRIPKPSWSRPARRRTEEANKNSVSRRSRNLSNPSGVYPMGQSTEQLAEGDCYLPLRQSPSSVAKVVTIENSGCRYNRLYQDPGKLTKYIFYTRFVIRSKKI